MTSDNQARGVLILCIMNFFLLLCMTLRLKKKTLTNFPINFSIRVIIPLKFPILFFKL